MKKDKPITHFVYRLPSEPPWVAPRTLADEVAGWFAYRGNDADEQIDAARTVLHIIKDAISASEDAVEAGFRWKGRTRMNQFEFPFPSPDSGISMHGGYAFTDDDGECFLVTSLAMPWFDAYLVLKPSEPR